MKKKKSSFLSTSGKVNTVIRELQAELNRLDAQIKRHQTERLHIKRTLRVLEGENLRVKY